MQTTVRRKPFLKGLLCKTAIVFAIFTISLFCVSINETAYGASVGSSFSTAASLSANKVVEGTISSSSPYYYKFTIDSGYSKMIICTIQGSKTATLYDCNQNLIGSCSSASSSSTGTKEYYLLGGTYYIKVSGANGGYNISRYYTNSRETVAETQTNRHDTFADAAQMNLNKLSVGQLGYKDTADAFIFEVPHKGTINVSKFFVSGDESVIKGQFYGYNGTSEGSSFSTANGSDDVYSMTISEGTHYVIFSGGTGKYYYNLSYSALDSEHVYGQWSVVTAATCDQAGTKQRSCSKCGKTQTETIPPAHVFGDWKTTKEATCTEAGSKERECTMCHLSETAVIEAGHKWDSGYTVDKKATYAAAGSKSIHCSACDAKKPGTVVSIPKLKVATPAVSKPKAIRKGFTIKWKKVSVATGYEVQYALNSKFTKSKKTVKIKKAATVSKKVTKLKAKKKYYVRVRAYKVVSGKTYYSTWCKAKTVKTKK